jgi:hypothetical protein
MEPPARQQRRRGPQGDPIGQAEQDSLLTATKASFAENTSAILRYPYKTGAVYGVPAVTEQKTTLLLSTALAVSLRYKSA